MLLEDRPGLILHSKLSQRASMAKLSQILPRIVRVHASAMEISHRPLSFFTPGDVASVSWPLSRSGLIFRHRPLVFFRSGACFSSRRPWAYRQLACQHLPVTKKKHNFVFRSCFAAALLGLATFTSAVHRGSEELRFMRTGRFEVRPSSKKQYPSPPKLLTL